MPRISTPYAKIRRIKARPTTSTMYPQPSMLAILLMLFHVPNTVKAHSTGAPPSTCDSMTPGHPGSSEPLPGPYSLSLSKQSYIPFEVVNVTINAPESVPFLGFMLQARDTSNNALTGSFIPAKGTTIICNQVLTHSSNSPKPSQTFTWRAPVVGTADIVFRATVVKDYFTYYMDFRSDVLKPRSTLATTIPTTSAPTTPKTTASTSTTTTTTKTLSTETTTIVPPSTKTTKASVATTTTSNFPTESTMKLLNTAIASTATSSVPVSSFISTLTTSAASSVGTSTSIQTTISKLNMTTASSTWPTMSLSSEASTSFTLPKLSTATQDSSTSPASASTYVSTPTQPTTSKLNTNSKSSPPRQASRNTTESYKSTAFTSMTPTITSPSLNDTGQVDTGTTQTPSGTRSTLTSSFDTSDDDEDRNFILYLSLGLVSGWACILFLGYIVRRFRSRPRPPRPSLVSFT